MSEEGEIPQHLRESVPSAEAYMEETRRDFQIAQKAWDLRIPHESLANATVRRYVGVLRDLEVARDQLEWPEIGDLVTPSAGSPRYDRESQIAGLYNCATWILQDGLGGHRLDRADLRHGLDNLARRYGGQVEHIDPRHPVPELPAARGPLWGGRSSEEPDPFEHRLWPGSSTEERGSWWTDSDLSPYERHDREYVSALSAEARRQVLHSQFGW